MGSGTSKKNVEKVGIEKIYEMAASGEYPINPIFKMEKKANMATKIMNKDYILNKLQKERIKSKAELCEHIQKMVRQQEDNQKNDDDKNHRIQCIEQLGNYIIDNLTIENVEYDKYVKDASLLVEEEDHEDEIELIVEEIIQTKRVKGAKHLAQFIKHIAKKLEIEVTVVKGYYRKQTGYVYTSYWNAIELDLSTNDKYRMLDLSNPQKPYFLDTPEVFIFNHFPTEYTTHQFMNHENYFITLQEWSEAIFYHPEALKKGIHVQQPDQPIFSPTQTLVEFKVNAPRDYPLDTQIEDNQRIYDRLSWIQYNGNEWIVRISIPESKKYRFAIINRDTNDPLLEFTIDATKVTGIYPLDVKRYCYLYPNIEEGHELEEDCLMEPKLACLEYGLNHTFVIHSSVLTHAIIITNGFLKYNMTKQGNVFTADVIVEESDINIYIQRSASRPFRLAYSYKQNSSENAAHYSVHAIQNNLQIMGSFDDDAIIRYLAVKMGDISTFHVSLRNLETNERRYDCVIAMNDWTPRVKEWLEDMEDVQCFMIRLPGKGQFLVEAYEGKEALFSYLFDCNNSNHELKSIQQIFVQQHEAWNSSSLTLESPEISESPAELDREDEHVNFSLSTDTVMYDDIRIYFLDTSIHNKPNLSEFLPQQAQKLVDAYKEKYPMQRRQVVPFFSLPYENFTYELEIPYDSIVPAVKYLHIVGVQEPTLIPLLTYELIKQEAMDD